MKEASELFDEFSDSYQESLEQALRASGEGREYFANGRVHWLKRCLGELNESPRTVLDFGCGDGATSPILREILAADSVLGTDISPKSIAQAQKTFANGAIAYTTLQEFRPAGQCDAAYCNGVFHHIPPAERLRNLSLVHSALRAGGLFSFWENSPWNPGTRYVMSRIPFDRDAILLTPVEARNLLKEAGFQIVRVDYRFIFPRVLGFLRKLEDLLYPLPLGTQYHVLCRKPRAADSGVGPDSRSHKRSALKASRRISTHPKEQTLFVGILRPQKRGLRMTHSWRVASGRVELM